MTETIEQFAARVAEGVQPYYGSWPASVRREILAELPGFLATLPPRVVEVTADDYIVGINNADALRVNGRPVAEEWTAAFLAGINACLRDRAGESAPVKPTLEVESWADAWHHAKAMTQAFIDDQRPRDKALVELRDYFDALMQADANRSRHVTDTGWITAPTTQTAEELNAPEAGLYGLRRVDGTVVDGTVRFRTGEKVAGHIDAIRRIDTNAPTTWIERSTTTTRAWTAESVQACVGKRVMTVSDENVTNADHWRTETPEYIAKCFNGWGIARYVIVQDGPR